MIHPILVIPCHSTPSYSSQIQQNSMVNYSTQSWSFNSLLPSPVLPHFSILCSWPNSICPRKMMPMKTINQKVIAGMLTAEDFQWTFSLSDEAAECSIWKQLSQVRVNIIKGGACSDLRNTHNANTEGQHIWYWRDKHKHSIISWQRCWLFKNWWFGIDHPSKYFTCSICEIEHLTKNFLESSKNC